MAAQAFAPTWINIPGQPHAFADREQELAQHYLGLVSAGKAVRESKTGVRYRVVVGDRTSVQYGRTSVQCDRTSVQCLCTEV